MIDKNCVEEYLSLANFPSLDPKKYLIVDIPATDRHKFTDIENSKIDSFNDIKKYQDLVGLSVAELENLISELKDKEKNTNSNNGVKYHTVKRLEAENYLKQLISEE